MCPPSWTSSPLPPHPIPLGHLSAPALSTLSHASNLDWWSVSHMIIHNAAAAKLLQSCLTLRSHRRQPTRLPRPWGSPGKNTGVGCHFLLQCIKMKSESEVAQLCPTLWDPMDRSLPGPFIHGIFQTRVLEWGAIAFSDNTHVSVLFSQIIPPSPSSTESKSLFFICVSLLLSHI